MNSFSRKLLSWFDRSGRTHLPWQQNKTSYRVWVSEIMLQQTQVTTVIPYYERFMNTFPTVHSLAEAKPDSVLNLWSGLGYYARARNLHKSAKMIVEQHGGQFPVEFEAVVNLPGIGRSTAGAILALSTEQRFAILDGNVKRVLCRYFGIEGYPGEPAIADRLWELADGLTPLRRVADYTQAIMDLGATLCTKAEPDCGGCPVRKECVALREGKVLELPTRKAKKVKPVRQVEWMVIVNSKKIDRKKSEILFVQRPSEGIWGGLWSFPESDKNIKMRAGRLLKPFRHTFTHFHLEITPKVYLVNDRVDIGKINQKGKEKHRRSEKYQWCSIAKPLKFGVPSPVIKVMKDLKGLIDVLDGT